MSDDWTPAHEHDVELNGTTLHYGTWGTYSGPDRTAILVHGLTANHLTWSALGPALAARGWYAVGVDLRGRGLSGKPAHGYGIPFHVNDLLSLSDALGLPSAHIVGHSLGAQIALYMAALFPTRVGKVVLVDAGGKVPEDALQTVNASVQRVGTIYPSVQAFVEQQRSASIYQWNDFWEKYYRYDIQSLPDGTATSRMPKFALEQEVTTNFFTRTEALLGYVRAPTLILRATVGTITPERGFILPREEAERMAREIANSRVVEVAGTNHYTIILAGETSREVLGFLAG
jgi:pimeloyl-ACP methyl ester carboxylesterase